MAEPLSRTDIATLDRGPGWYHVSVDVFDGGASPITLDELCRRLADRLAFAPRFRQRIRETVTGLDWIDDVDFDVAQHVHLHMLTPPGDLAQVTDLVATGLATPFDAHRPQWDMLLVHGLRGGQFAVVTRVHPAYVDGMDNVHLLHELYEEEPSTVVPEPVSWTPSPEPKPADDLVSGLVTGIADPGAMFGRLGQRLARGVGQGIDWVSEQRLPVVGRTDPVRPATRYAGGALLSLAAIDRVRDRTGSTTHDVICALITAGVRQWQTQLAAEPRDVVALIPLGIAQAPGVVSAVGCQIAAQFVTLPATTASPQGRIDQLTSLTRSRIDTGRPVPASTLTTLSGFAPATLHPMAARTVTAGRTHEVFIANAPGPRGTRYLGRWPLHSSYPVTGPTEGQDLTVCVTSYSGRVGFGAAGRAPVAPLVAGIIAELSRLDAGQRR